MVKSFNIYCDESCHLENDYASHMTLGALTCPKDKTKEVYNRIKEIKEKHDISKWQELKWTKISPKNYKLYCDLIDYFFDDDDLTFRAISCAKKSLSHEKYMQTHDDWYYKMYFFLLRRILNDRNNFYIYLDIKDTRSADKKHTLHNTLCNDKYDFNREFIKNIQHIRSHEVSLMQLSDILIGAVSYDNRKLSSNLGKVNLINHILKRSNLNTLRKTNYSNKFNIFQWEGQ